MYINGKRKILIALAIVATVFVCIVLFLFNKRQTVLYIEKDNVSLVCTYDGKESVVNGQSVLADNNIHLFAPSFFDLDNIVIESTQKYEITHGYYYENTFSETIINDGQVSPAILLSSNDGKSIVIHQLENDDLFIDLKNDYVLEDIKNDKELRVKANIQNIDKYGNTIYDGELNYIKGRGNASWLNEKRGYLLSFSNQVSLENIKETRKFVLTPSFYDMTGMRNKLVYDLANDLGLKYTPDAKYVNVFVDGNYEGLYLITQQVYVDDYKENIQEEKTLNIKKTDIENLREIKYYDNSTPSKTKRYLIEREIKQRYNENIKDAGFITEKGNCYIVHNSKSMMFEELKEIALKVQELEDSLYEKDDTKYLDLIDLDSWSKQYLIELLSQNLDSYRTSSYFYYDINERIFYGGPVWDYDGTLGCGTIKTQDSKDMSIANNVLSSKKEIINRVTEIFNDKIYNEKDNIIYGKTNEYSNNIKKDMYLNALRYNQQKFIVSNYLYEDYDYDLAVTSLQGRLYERIEYLKDLLNSKTKYHKVKFVTNNDYCESLTYLIAENKMITDDREVPYYYSGNGFVWNKPLWISKWVDKDGNDFDFSTPITEDIELYAVWGGDTDAWILQK